MRVKICGLTKLDNAMEIAALGPDMIGFIFHPGSPRYANVHEVRKIVKALPEDITTVGVFVNRPLQHVMDVMRLTGLDAVQLHGYEDVQTCAILKEAGYQVIKVFHVESDIDFEKVEPYTPHCDLFLFDTKTKKYGGSGKHFNWEILQYYPFDTPFFLSGGIGPADLEQIRSLDLPNLTGIDVNSKIETLPGVKNVNKAKMLFETTLIS